MSDRWTDKKRGYSGDGGIPSVAQRLSFLSKQREDLGGLDLLSTRTFDAEGNEVGITRFGKYERGYSIKKPQKEEELKGYVIFTIKEGEDERAVMVWDLRLRRVHYGPCLPDDEDYKKWYNSKTKVSTEDLFGTATNCGRGALAPHAAFQFPDFIGIVLLGSGDRSYYFKFPGGFPDSRTFLSGTDYEQTTPGCHDLYNGSDTASNTNTSISNNYEEWYRLGFTPLGETMLAEIDCDWNINSSLPERAYYMWGLYPAKQEIYPSSKKYKINIPNTPVEYTGIRTHRQNSFDSERKANGWKVDIYWDRVSTDDYRQSNTSDVFYSPWGVMGSFEGNYKYTMHYEEWDLYGDGRTHYAWQGYEEYTVESTIIPSWDVLPNHVVAGQELPHDWDSGCHGWPFLYNYRNPFMSASGETNIRIVGEEEAYALNRKWFHADFFGQYGTREIVSVAIVQYTPCSCSYSQKVEWIFDPDKQDPDYQWNVPAPTIGFEMQDRNIIVHAQTLSVGMGPFSRDFLSKERNEDLEPEIVKTIEYAYEQMGLDEKEIYPITIDIEVVR